RASCRPARRGAAYSTGSALGTGSGIDRVRAYGRDRPLVAAERLPEFMALFQQASTSPPIEAPAGFAEKFWSFQEPLVEILRGRMGGLGPGPTAAMAASMGLPESDVDPAMLALEGEGFILRGRFTPGAESTEWCVRRLLSRIRNYTLNRLRQEIEPVSSADFIRFLLSWQGVSSEPQPEGVEGLAGGIGQVEGFEATAAALQGQV